MTVTPSLPFNALNFDGGEVHLKDGMTLEEALAGWLYFDVEYRGEVLDVELKQIHDDYYFQVDSKNLFAVEPWQGRSKTIRLLQPASQAVTEDVIVQGVNVWSDKNLPVLPGRMYTDNGRIIRLADVFDANGNTSATIPFKVDGYFPRVEGYFSKLLIILNIKGQLLLGEDVSSIGGLVEAINDKLGGYADCEFDGKEYLIHIDYDERLRDVEFYLQSYKWPVNELTLGDGVVEITKEDGTDEAVPTYCFFNGVYPRYIKENDVWCLPFTPSPLHNYGDSRMLNVDVNFSQGVAHRSNTHYRYDMDILWLADDIFSIKFLAAGREYEDGPWYSPLITPEA